MKNKQENRSIGYQKIGHLKLRRNVERQLKQGRQRTSKVHKQWNAGKRVGGRVVCTSNSMWSDAYSSTTQKAQIMWLGGTHLKHGNRFRNTPLRCCFCCVGDGNDGKRKQSRRNRAHAILLGNLHAFSTIFMSFTV